MIAFLLDLPQIPPQDVYDAGKRGVACEQDAQHSCNLMARKGWHVYGRIRRRRLAAQENLRKKQYCSWLLQTVKKAARLSYLALFPHASRG